MGCGSDLVLAAVEHELVPGHETALVRREEERTGRDLLGAGQPAQRDARRHPLDQRVGRRQPVRWTCAPAGTPGHAALVRRMFFDGLDPAALPALRTALEAVHEQVLASGTLPRPPQHQHRLPGLQTDG